MLWARADLACTLYTIQHWLGASFYLLAILGFPAISQVPQPNGNTCREKEVKASHSTINKKIQFS